LTGFRASSTTDEVIIKGLKKWSAFIFPKSFLFKKHASYAAALDSIIIEEVEPSFSQFKKSKLAPKHLQKMTQDIKNNMFRFDPFMLKRILLAQVNKIEFVRHCNKHPYPISDFFIWVKERGVQIKDFNTSVDYVWNASSRRFLLHDKRSRVLAVDVLNSFVSMTSGYVPPNPIYSSTSTPCGRYYQSSRPILLTHSQVPTFEERLTASKRAYEDRKKIQRNENLFDNTTFASFIAIRERSKCEEDIHMQECRMRCCSDISNPNATRDKKMIHTGFCSDQYQDEDILLSSERLWFINNVEGMHEEYRWLDAKVRQNMTDVYHFDCCSWCGEPYKILNFMKLRSARSRGRKEDTIPSRVLDWMRYFCSYSCLDKMIIDFMRYESQKDLNQTKFDKVVCSACEKVTYSFSDPENTWKYMDYSSPSNTKLFLTHEMDMMPVCSDDCFIYLRSKINEKRKLRFSATTLATFSFYTCFTCSKILLPTSKICCYRSFPRLPAAFSCYSSDCIAGVLCASMPIDPLTDPHFMASSLAPPFDILPSVEGSSMLQKLNLYKVSSANGGRFTLSILE
jgi:hypothetical protein